MRVMKQIFRKLFVIQMDDFLLNLPKVEVAQIEMSCHIDPVETLTWITSLFPSPPTSLLCTNMPPGLTSHSMTLLPPPLFAPPATMPALELLLNSLLATLNLIIFSKSIFARIEMTELWGREILVQRGVYIKICGKRLHKRE